MALADGFETSSFAAFVSKFDSATCLAFGIGVDGSCCSEIVSPASYNMPELGCSRRAGFGDTNNGGACSGSNPDVGDGPCTDSGPPAKRNVLDLLSRGRNSPASYGQMMRRM